MSEANSFCMGKGLPPIRVGLGDDTHRTDPNAKAMILGGCRIECGFGLIGHSDADVLLHAVTDALLGAAALGDGFGDIGECFPDTDPANCGRSSSEMLAMVWKMIRHSPHSCRIVNLSCIIHAQRPKIQPYRAAIRRCIAEILGITLDQVSISAKTGELVGPVGCGEAITATAVVLLARSTG